MTLKPSSDKKTREQHIENELLALRELQKLSEENGQLKDENQSLKNRIAWFEKQVFGQKSEKRIIENPHQASLLSEPTETEIETAPTKDINGYQRGTAKKIRPDDCTTEGFWGHPRLK